MNVTTKINLEVVKNEHSFVFSLPINTDWGTAHSACVELANQIVKLNDEAKARLEEADKKKNESDECKESCDKKK